MKSWPSVWGVAGFALLLDCAPSMAADDEMSLQRGYSEARVLLAGLAAVIPDFYGLKKRCPATNSEAGLAEPTDLRGTYVAATRVGTRDGACTATVEFGEKAAPPLRGKSIGAKLKPDSSWECFSDIDPKYLPCKEVHPGPSAPQDGPLSMPAIKLTPPPPPPKYIAPIERSEDEVDAAASGDYPRAIAEAQRSLALAQQQQGAGSEILGPIAHTIATYEILDHHTDRARPFLEQELETATPKDVDLALAQTLAEVGHTLELAHPPKPAEATPLFQQALAINEKLLEPNDLHIALSMFDLAGNYTLQEKYTEAEHVYRQSLAIVEKSPSADGKIAVLTDFAWMYSKQHRYHEAEPLLKRALDIAQKEPETRGKAAEEVREKLANLYRETGRAADANALTDSQLGSGNHEPD